MKLQLLSDLHLEVHPQFRISPAAGADLLVLAGDIGSYQAGSRLMAPDFGLTRFSPRHGWPTPVLYVPGNHEYDNADFDQTHERLRTLCQALDILWLERETCVIGGVRFVGTTLWADRESSEKVEAEVTNPFQPGDPLPGGLIAHATARSDEVVVWDPESRSLFVGDVILGKGPIGIELCPESWLPDGVGLADLKASLQPLLELPIERILPGHGEPVDREARSSLERLL